MMMKRMKRMMMIRRTPEDTRSKKADVEANGSVRQQLARDGIISKNTTVLKTLLNNSKELV